MESDADKSERLTAIKDFVIRLIETCTDFDLLDLIKKLLLCEL